MAVYNRKPESLFKRKPVKPLLTINGFERIEGYTYHHSSGHTVICTDAISPDKNKNPVSYYQLYFRIDDGDKIDMTLHLGKRISVLIWADGNIKSTSLNKKSISSTDKFMKEMVKMFINEGFVK